MIKILKTILIVLASSFYIFPFEFTVLPGINTKMMLAAIGLAFIAYELFRQKEFAIPRELLILLFLCSMVSILSLFSISYNQTPDTSYVSYLISATVWISGAFTIVSIMRAAHGYIDVPLIVHYLIGVCLFQCTATMLIAFVPAFQSFIDQYVQCGQSLWKELDRLYGIGCAVDVGGLRFSAVLVSIAFLFTSSPRKVPNWLAVFYTLSFIVISVIGNMIARTATIGMVIGIVWLLLAPFLSPSERGSEKNKGKGFVMLITTAVLISISVTLYNTIPQMKEFFRFGFEGFFSLIEVGEWQVSSNEVLKKMLVLPEELRTWIIGDGYFLNSRYDPNYLGHATDQGFYMGTDIGYLRFIFYFGIAGLVWIVAVVAYSAIVCCRYFKEYTWLFVMALLVGLVVWAKVSTDIFCFFALFLCAAALRDGEHNTSSNTLSPR